MQLGYIQNNTALFNVSEALSRNSLNEIETSGFEISSEVPTDFTSGPTVDFNSINILKSPARYKLVANKEYPSFTIIAETDVIVESDIHHGVYASFDYINLTANQDGYIVKIPGRTPYALRKNICETFYSYTLEIDFSQIDDFADSWIEIDVEYFIITQSPDTPSPDTPSPDIPSPDTPTPGVNIPSPDTPSPGIDTSFPDGSTEGGTDFLKLNQNFKLLVEDE